jgi:hypothetical protein
MPMFRKKPEIVEAMQLPSAAQEGATLEEMVAAAHGARTIADWCGGKLRINQDGPFLTFYNRCKAKPLDWVVKDEGGTFQVIKPDIFAATYEEVQQ